MSTPDIILSVAIILLLLLIWIILYDSSRFVVKRVEIKASEIKKPLRAVVISDLHNRQYGKLNIRLLEAIESANPDCILGVGDFVKATPDGDQSVTEHLLEELVKKYPVFFGIGNHEHRLLLYPETYGDAGTAFMTFLKDKKVTVLANEKIVLEENGICLYGLQIDKEYYRRFGIQPMQADYIPSEIGLPDKGYFNVLIAHNPDYYPQYAEWGADLTLSGHVHGGVVRIPFGGRGILSPNVRFFPKYDGGVFELPKGESQDVLKSMSRKWHAGLVNAKDRRGTMVLNAGKSSILLVSRGIGNHSIPIRFCNPAELIVVDFLPDNG